MGPAESPPTSSQFATLEELESEFDGALSRGSWRAAPEALEPDCLSMISPFFQIGPSGESAPWGDAGEDLLLVNWV